MWILAREQALTGLGRDGALRGSATGLSSRATGGGSCTVWSYDLAAESAARLAAERLAILGDPAEAAGLEAVATWRAAPVDRLETVPWNPIECNADDAREAVDLLSRPDAFYAVVRTEDVAAVLIVSPSDARYLRSRFSYRRGDERNLGDADF
ncbi:MAG: hypothetical protein AAFW46_04550 [Pseudomonadota bacterium]